MKKCIMHTKFNNIFSFILMSLVIIGSLNVDSAWAEDARTYYSLGHRTQAAFSSCNGVEGKVVLPAVTGLGGELSSNNKPEVAYQYLGVESFGQTIDFGLMKSKKNPKTWTVFAFYVANDEANAKKAYDAIQKKFPKTSSRYGKAPFFNVWTELPKMAFADGKAVRMKLQVSKQDEITLTVTDGKVTYTIPYRFVTGGTSGKGLIFRRESNLIAYGGKAGIDGNMVSTWTEMALLNGSKKTIWTKEGYFYRDDSGYKDGVPKNVKATLILDPLSCKVHYGVSPSK